MDITFAGDRISLTVEDCDADKRAHIQWVSRNGVTETALNLDEIFEAYVIGNKGRSKVP
ncbi:MAG: hypothetical protein JW944_11515 [Deltaproteobacteria bacterium]|nr:hypothetical protein [Deltaproteobacteria bacterium]